MRSDGIPKRFQLLGHTIAVKVVPPSRWKHGKGCVGIWIPDDLRIEIISTAKGSYRQVVWWHEACHAMLDLAGYEKLSRDEQFVDRFAHLIQQVLATSTME